jgi:hypothetical protein
MKHVLRAAFLASALGACATSAGNGAVWVPPAGLSNPEIDAAVAACQQAAAQVRAPAQQVTGNYSSGAAAFGSALGAGLAQGAADGQARRSALWRCMNNSGFVAIYLSPEQTAQMEAIPVGPERGAFMQSLAEVERQRLAAIAAKKPAAAESNPAGTPLEPQ